MSTLRSGMVRLGVRCGIPLLVCAVIGYLMGSWLVFLLLCMPAVAVVWIHMLSRIDERTMSRLLARAAKERHAKGDLRGASFEYERAARILKAARDLTDADRQRIEMLLRRAYRLRR